MGKRIILYDQQTETETEKEQLNPMTDVESVYRAGNQTDKDTTSVGSTIFTNNQESLLTILTRINLWFQKLKELNNCTVATDVNVGEGNTTALALQSTVNANHKEMIYNIADLRNEFNMTCSSISSNVGQNSERLDEIEDVLFDENNRGYMDITNYYDGMTFGIDWGEAKNWGDIIDEQGTSVKNTEAGKLLEEVYSRCSSIIGSRYSLKVTRMGSIHGSYSYLDNAFDGSVGLGSADGFQYNKIFSIGDYFICGTLTPTEKNKHLFLDTSIRKISISGFDNGDYGYEPAQEFYVVPLLENVYDGLYTVKQIVILFHLLAYPKYAPSGRSYATQFDLR